MPDSSNSGFNFDDIDKFLQDESEKNNEPENSEPEPTPVQEPDYEFESQLLLRGLEDELNAIEESFRSEQIQIEAIEAEEYELRKKLAELARRKTEYENHRKEIRFDRNRKQRQIEDQQRRVELDRQIKKQKQALAARAEEFDERTKDAKWRGKAFQHQLDGAHFLASAGRAICADGMGLGKTLESLMTIEMLGCKRTLIVCPGDVASVFEREVRRWTNKSVVQISRKTKAMQLMALSELVPDLSDCVVILNYDAWKKNFALLTWLKDAAFDSAILDEAHSFKETKTAVYKGVSEVILAENHCPEFGCDTHFEAGLDTFYCIDHGYVEPVSSIKNVFCMTGTPILNRPKEIYPSLHLVHPDIFQTVGDFNRTFTYSMGEEWSLDGHARLAQQISGFYIQRDLKTAGIKLPPQDQYIHEIELDAELYPLQHEIMEMLFREAQIKIAEEETMPIASLLALITRQRQASVWPGGIWLNKPVMDEYGNITFDDDGEQVFEKVHVGQNYQQSCKLDKAEELYNELVSSGHRVVFFSQFKEALREMKRRLGDDVVEYTGDTSIADRDIIKQNFDASVGEEPKWKGVLCHYKTGGVGLTLTAATAMIILDEEWNEGKAQQAYDRIHRIGQTEQTQVHILRHVGPEYSVDNWLADLIDRKSKIVAGFKYSIEELKGAFGG